MFKKKQERWDRLAEYAKRGELSWTDYSSIIVQHKKYIIVKWHRDFFIFPSVNRIDLKRIPIIYRKYPRIGPYNVGCKYPTIKCWGSGTEVKTSIIYYGIKSGKNFDINNTKKIEERIIKEAI